MNIIEAIISRYINSKLTELEKIVNQCDMEDKGSPVKNASRDLNNSPLIQKAIKIKFIIELLSKTR